MATPPISNSSSWENDIEDSVELGLSRQTEESPVAAQTAEANQAHSVEEAPMGHLEGEQISSTFGGLPLEIQEKIVDHLANKDVHNLRMTGQAFAAATSRRRELVRTAHDVLMNYGVAHLVGKKDTAAVYKLHVFVTKCKPEELRAVVVAGKLDVNAISGAGSALHEVIERLFGSVEEALQTNKEDALKKISILLEAGADPNKTGQNSQSCLQSVLQKGASVSSPKLVPMLLDAGAEPNAITSATGSMLNIATSTGDIEAVRHLIEAGADPELGHRDLNDAPLITVEQRIENATDPVQRSKYGEIRAMLREAIDNKRESGVNSPQSVRYLIKSHATPQSEPSITATFLSRFYNISMTEQDVQRVLDLETQSKKS